MGNGQGDTGLEPERIQAPDAAWKRSFCAEQRWGERVTAWQYPARGHFD